MKYLPKEKLQPGQQAVGYTSKPKGMPRLKIVRECLNCDRSFIADGRFQRLCDLHRNGDE